MNRSCDSNVLFHALNVDSPFHVKAASYISARRDDERFRICELVLVELYVLLRNPSVLRQPLTAPAASQLCQRLRNNPSWGVLDYPGPLSRIMDRVWTAAADSSFARRRIFDVRLAYTLTHHGVTEFATQNVRDFQEMGFASVFNPLA